MIGGKEKMRNTNVRVSEEVRIKLEEYRIKKGLHKNKVTISQIAGQIVSNWLKDPFELKEYIEAEKKSKVIRSTNVTVSLKDDDKAKLYEIFAEKYIKEVVSVNVLLYVILVEFMDNNYEDFDIKKVFSEV